MKIKHSGPKTGWAPDLAGMTLVEVVVALAITGVAVGGIISGYTFCTVSSQSAALSLAASARAMERIEETHGAIWAPNSSTPDQLVAANFTNKVVMLDMSGSGNGIVPATIHTEISQVTITPPSPGTKYTFKRIRVDCIWSFKGSQMFTNTIETCRAPDQ